jgi:hypothetical protein
LSATQRTGRGSPAAQQSKEHTGLLGRQTPAAAARAFSFDVQSFFPSTGNVISKQSVTRASYQPLLRRLHLQYVPRE